MKFYIEWSEPPNEFQLDCVLMRTNIPPFDLGEMKWEKFGKIKMGGM